MEELKNICQNNLGMCYHISKILRYEVSRACLKNRNQIKGRI